MTPLYRVAHIVVSWVAWVLFRLQVQGVEQVPQEGGILIAANHTSYWDIPLLGCSLPRQVDFMGKAELFAVPLVGTFLRALGGFPIRRGQMDRQALVEALRRLQAGRAVGIFPEGRRSPDGRLLPGRPGIGILVATARVPVVPAYLEGTQRWTRLPRITIRFGAPLDFTPLFEGVDPVTRRRRYQEVADRVMEAIATLGGVPAPSKG